VLGQVLRGFRPPPVVVQPVAGLREPVDVLRDGDLADGPCPGLRHVPADPAERPRTAVGLPTAFLTITCLLPVRLEVHVVIDQHTETIRGR